MKCADCKWWERITVPDWAPKQPERWATILKKDPHLLDTGECGRPYNDGYGTNLMSVELNYSLYTRDVFGCVQFEPRDGPTA